MNKEHHNFVTTLTAIAFAIVISSNSYAESEKTLQAKQGGGYRIE